MCHLLVSWVHTLYRPRVNVATDQNLFHFNFLHMDLESRQNLKVLQSGIVFKTVVSVVKRLFGLYLSLRRNA